MASEPLVAERVAQPVDPLAAPRELALEGMAKMLHALIGTVPRCTLPHIDENGDIILRRKRPDAPPPAPKRRAI